MPCKNKTMACRSNWLGDGSSKGTGLSSVADAYFSTAEIAAGSIHMVQ